MTPRGHRLLPHTADVRLEAWGPTREDCLAEAVRALAASFVEWTGTPTTSPLAVDLPAAPSDADLLVALLEEVIYAVDVLGVVPIDAHLAPDGGAITGTFDAAALAALVAVGSAPKAITRHGLWFGQDDDGAWRCSVTVDV
jgi:SHS2 domain-containing protein